MKETILLYHFEDKERLDKIRRALLPLGMRMKQVSRDEYKLPVGYLAGSRETSSDKAAEQDRGELDGEMLVMAWLSGRQVDQVLAALRRQKVGKLDYKAVLTPQNQHWDAWSLFEELKREHEAFAQGRNL